MKEQTSEYLEWNGNNGISVVYSHSHHNAAETKSTVLSKFMVQEKILSIVKNQFKCIINMTVNKLNKKEGKQTFIAISQAKCQ